MLIHLLIAANAFAGAPARTPLRGVGPPDDALRVRRAEREDVSVWAATTEILDALFETASESPLTLHSIRARSPGERVEFLIDLELPEREVDLANTLDATLARRSVAKDAPDYRAVRASIHHASWSRTRPGEPTVRRRISFSVLATAGSQRDPGRVARCVHAHELASYVRGAAMLDQIELGALPVDSHDLGSCRVEPLRWGTVFPRARIANFFHELERRDACARITRLGLWRVGDGDSWDFSAELERSDRSD